MIRKAGDRSNWKVKLLLYGCSDSGKTYCSSRLSEKFRTIILDIEGGEISAPPELPYGEFSDAVELLKMENAEKYPSAMIKIATWEEFETMLGYLRRQQGRYDVVVVDSVTEAQKRCIDHVKAIPKGLTVIQNLDALSLQGWGSLGEKFRFLIRGYRDLPCHVVFTAMEVNFQDEENGIIRWMPLLDGKKSPFELVGWMDIVGHAIKRERRTNEGRVVERIFRFHSNGREEAKVRGGLLDEEVPADLVKVFEKLLGGEDNDKGKVVQ
jgi:hypothetical protein